MADVNYNTMSLRTLERLIRGVWLPRGAAVVITSAPGFAKTSMCLSLVQRMQAANHDFGSGYMNVGAADSVDLIGMPLLTDPDYPLTVTGMPLWAQPDPARGLRGAYCALAPEHLRAAPLDQRPVPAALQAAYAEKLSRSMRSFERGALIVDEVGATLDNTVQQPLSRLANEASINGWGVDHRTWVRLMLTNAADQGAGARDLLTHLGNRVRHVRIKPDPEDYLAYWSQSVLLDHQSRDQEGHLQWSLSPMRPEFRYFASWLPSLVFDERACEQGARFCSPRSYEAASLDVSAYARNVLRLSDEEDLPLERPEILQLIACACGDAVASQLVGYMPYYSARVRMEDVLDDPAKVPVPNEPIALSIFIDTLVDGFNPADEAHMKAASVLMRRVPKLYAGRWCARFADRYSAPVVIASVHFEKVMEYAGSAAMAPMLLGGGDA